MPIPKPKSGEEKDVFISRCMGDKTMNKEYPDQKQRAGVCHSQFKESTETLKRDERGRIIVAENIPVIFTGTIIEDINDQ